MAPQVRLFVVKGKVIVGTAGGIAASTACTATSHHRQTGLAVLDNSGPGEFGSESWPGDRYLHGGGTTWMRESTTRSLTRSIGIHTDLRRTSLARRPGDDFTQQRRCSIRIPGMKWQFINVTPHDLYTTTLLTAVLVDAEYNKLEASFGSQPKRFVYVLDRVTGEFLSGNAIRRKMNWADGIDSKGRLDSERKECQTHSQEGSLVALFSGAQTGIHVLQSGNTRSLLMALEAWLNFILRRGETRRRQDIYGTGCAACAGERVKRFCWLMTLIRPHFVGAIRKPPAAAPPEP